MCGKFFYITTLYSKNSLDITTILAGTWIVVIDRGRLYPWTGSGKMVQASLSTHQLPGSTYSDRACTTWYRDRSVQDFHCDIGTRQYGSSVPVHTSTCFQQDMWFFLPTHKESGEPQIN